VKPTITLLIALLLSSSIAAAPKRPSAKDDAAVIRQSLEDWVKAHNSHDLPGTLATFDSSVLGSFQGFPDQDYAAHVKSYTDEFARTDLAVTFTLTIEEIHVEGRMAYVRDRWLQTITSSDGKTIGSTLTRSIEIWRKQNDGQWRIVRWIAYPIANGKQD